ncbi:MAG: hypothetical protein Kow0090_23340 [Myxococcota bacterium]
MIAELSRFASDVGFFPPEGWAEKVRSYFCLLMKWNATQNLTTHTEEEFLQKDIADCLYSARAISAVFKSRRCLSVLDVGSGAGVPGLILAAMFPQFKFTLAESRRKRVSFLKTARIEMNLQNVKILAQRISGKENFAFDLCLSRAALGFAEFIPLAPVWLKKGGALLLMLGGADVEKESETLALALKNGFSFAAREEYFAADTRRTLLLLSYYKGAK